MNIFSSSLNFIINGEERNVGSSLVLNDGNWHHIVLMWTKRRGEFKAYVDGTQVDQGYNLSTIKDIPGR